MDNKLIPEEIAQFLTDTVESVAQLEALLLLRNNPDETWTNDYLAQRLYISPKLTSELLTQLCANGLVESYGSEPVCFRYRPASNEIETLIARLAELYAKHLVPVTNLIHSKPKTRIQEFADAFRLRKDK